MEALMNKAEGLAERKLDVVKLKDGTFMVEWFDLNGPPPTGSTEEEALEKFIKHLENSSRVFANSGEPELGEEAEGLEPT